MISKATFCAALSLIKQQSAINEEFSKALEKSVTVTSFLVQTTSTLKHC